VDAKRNYGVNEFSVEHIILDHFDWNYDRVMRIQEET
jgi:hypothetical protein